MSRLTKAAAVLALVFYGLASMHCLLESVPGFGFLKTCCFADAGPCGPQDCERDGCRVVEDGTYRMEEQTASAPQPVLGWALMTAVMQAPPPAVESHPFVRRQPPPELPRSWQFSFRAALAPRAPSLIG